LLSPKEPGNTLPVLILNACPHLELQRKRAKILNDAGYYTSSARTTDEVAEFLRMPCALAIVCHEFTPAEQRAIQAQLTHESPNTKLLMLDHTIDNDPKAFLAKVKRSLYKLEMIEPDERSA
jgi:hypothetical protein